MTGTWSATVDDRGLPMMWLYDEKRPSDDEIEPTCSVKELLEQTQGEKDDKMGAVF